MNGSSELRQVVFDATLTEGADGLELSTDCEVVGELESPVAVDAEALDEIAAEVSDFGRAPAKEEQQRKLGQRLYEAAFGCPARQLLDRARGFASGKDLPLLLRIRLPESERLHRVPWELINDGQTYLAKDPATSLVRTSRLPLGVRSTGVDGPLRVLLTYGPPLGEEVIDVTQEVAELEHIRRVLGGRIEIVHHEGAVTEEGLRTYMRPGPDPIHVWHHCGHGGYPPANPRKFHLLLSKSDGNEWVPARRISERAGGSRDLQMVMMSTCFGGSFAGLARDLSRINVPLVVAFPREVGVSAAREFSSAFHSHMAFLPPELAISAARAELASRETLEWSQPILFARRVGFEPLARLGSRDEPSRPAVKPPPARAAAHHSGGRRISMKVEGIKAGGNASVQAPATDSGDIDLDIREIEAKKDVNIFWLEDTRNYRRKIHRFLTDMHDVGEGRSA